MSSPLFILAPPRSFTSVTCAMIGQHPELMGLPETNLFARDTYREMLQLFRLRERFAHGLYRAIAELGLGGQNRQNIQLAKDWLERDPSLSTADIYRDIIAFASPCRLVEKSPLHVYNAESLNRLNVAFPDACYLHITRHPRGTCESIYSLRKSTEKGTQKLIDKNPALANRVRKIKPDDALTPENMWFDPHLNILEFLDKVEPSKQLRLRGEDFLSEPDKYLPQIAEWLGVSTDAEAIESMKHPEESPFACFGPPNALFGNDPGFLKEPALRPYIVKPQELESPLSWNPELRFSDIVIELAEYLGY
jgi:hypothetical protein